MYQMSHSGVHAVVWTCHCAFIFLYTVRPMSRHVTQPCTHFRPCKRPIHGRITAVYTTGTRPCTSTRHVHGRRRPCTRPVHSRVHGRCIQAVCTACTLPCTRPWTGGTALVYGGLHGPYVYTAHTRQSTWPCNGSYTCDLWRNCTCLATLMMIFLHVV